MKALASFVLPGEAVADIGTDHGFVPIDLLAENIVPFAVMTDINEGPLNKAKGNLDRVGILPQFYELRQCDGLELVKNAEVSTVIIAGMGAETIIDILSADIEKTKSYKRLILQPRKRSWELREWLNKNNITVTNEKLVKEDEKICEIIVCDIQIKNDIPYEETNSPAKIVDYYYLPVLLRKDPLFIEFAKDLCRKFNVVINNMANSDATDSLVSAWKEKLAEAERIINEYS